MMMTYRFNLVLPILQLVYGKCVNNILFNLLTFSAICGMKAFPLMVFSPFLRKRPRGFFLKESGC